MYDIDSLSLTCFHINTYIHIITCSLAMKITKKNKTAGEKTCFTAILRTLKKNP